MAKKTTPIVLNIAGKTTYLTVQQAKDLKRQLDEIFEPIQSTSTPEQPSPGYVPNGGNWVYWCNEDNVKATSSNDSKIKTKERLGAARFDPTR